MPLVIHVVGIGRESGKTRLIEDLVESLMLRGYSVCTVKHIFEGSFDTPQKDTWRHLRAGATSVIVVSPNEIIRIKKSIQPSLKTALKQVPDCVDIVLVEGFKKSENLKIIVARTVEEVNHLIGEIKGIIAVSGPITEKGAESLGIDLPILGSQALTSLIEHMILENIVAKLPNLNCGKCIYKTCGALAKAIIDKEATLGMCIAINEGEVLLTVNGKRISLSGFPQEFIKKTLLGMITSLKGVGDGISSVIVEVKSIENKE